MSLSNVFKSGHPSFQKVVPLSLGELKADGAGKSVSRTLSSKGIKKSKKEIEAEAALAGEKEKELQREAELAEAKQQSYDEGFLKGKDEGVAETSKKLDLIMEGFLSAGKELDTLKGSLLIESEKDVLKLVVAAARKIVLRELSVDKEIVVDVIKNALKSLTDRKEIIIRVNPEDMQMIHDQKKRFFGDVDYLKELTFIEDESLGRGGCLIESKFGEIDARINKQLELLDEGILNALSEH